MATSYYADLYISSALAFTRVGGAFVGTLPKIETIKSLESDTTSTAVGFDGEIRLLSVAPLELFETSPLQTSTYQTVYVSNSGTAALTITGLVFSQKDGVELVSPDLESIFAVDEGTGITGTITVLPGETTSFDIAYYGIDLGFYTNRLTLLSNNTLGPHKFYTRQSVFNTSTFSTDDWTVTSNAPGQPLIHTFGITPQLNYFDRPDLQWNVTATADPANIGWSVIDQGVNYFTVKFKPNTVGNVNGTYNTTFTVSAENVSDISSVSATVILDIDYSKYINYGSWISAAAEYNSIFGISYDLINDVRMLTIGVGLGGSDTPQYGAGGTINATTATLNYLGTSFDKEFIGWSTVYRIPLTSDYGTPAIYYSGAKGIEDDYLYKVKTTAGLEYETYFGTESHQGSMFIVKDDGYKNITVYMNHLREVTNTDDQFDKTLRNLTEAFYYYTDNPERYTNISVGPIIDGTVTEKFVGFNNSGTVLTNIVSLP